MHKSSTNMENPQTVQKVSQSFINYEMLSDTDCSEDYDHDPFYQNIEIQEEDNVPEQQPEEENKEMDEEQFMQQEEKEERRRIRDLGLQNSALFEVNLSDYDNASFARFIEIENTLIEQNKLKNSIEEYVQQLIRNNLVTKGSAYQEHFNFGLNTTTWRLFVNKQILMRYERLFIEKQMNEVKIKKNHLEKQLSDLDQSLLEVKQKQENIKNRGSNNSQLSQNINQSQPVIHQQPHIQNPRRPRNHHHMGGGHHQMFPHHAQPPQFYPQQFMYPPAGFPPQGGLPMPPVMFDPMMGQPEMPENDVKRMH